MSYRSKLLPLAALLLATGPVHLLADEASHQEAVKQLFELTAMQQKIEESVDSVLALQLAQNPALRDHETVVREFLERHIGWNSLEYALTGMYMQEFSGVASVTEIHNVSTVGIPSAPIVSANSASRCGSNPFPASEGSM